VLQQQIVASDRIQCTKCTNAET